MDNNLDLSKLDINQLNKILDRLTPQEKELALSVLKEYASKGHSETLDNIVLSDFDEIPVDIHTFLHDKKYLGNALYDNGRFTVFPYWEKTLHEIFPDNISTRYNTVIFTGAIGLGKSTIAVIILLYLLHRLLCLKDPYNYYGLQPIDKISISFMNITLENAKGVAMDKMNQMLLSSEWFMTHGEMAGTVNLEYRPSKHIELIAASSNNQVIGRALFGNFTDEVNFGLTNNVEKLKKKQKTLISQIDARMKSRFMRTRKNGSTYLPTINIIASSKNSDQSFLDDYINTKKKNESKTTLIIDEPQWVVDSRKDNPIKFWVALGDKFKANELLPKDAPQALVDEYKAKGYQMLAVPIGYWENFLDNLDGALTDIAGISTLSSIKFISGMRWNEIKTKSYENPFMRDVITVGNAPDDKVEYSDFFDMTKINSDYMRKPMYIHLDLSSSGDKTGIAGVWITQKVDTGDYNDSSEMFFRVAFSVSIQAPKGYEISFEKNRRFIRWLRDKGFKIAGITADQFQSTHIRQQLKADGFEVDKLSVDELTNVARTGEENTEDGVKKSPKKACLPYQYFRSCINEHRLEVYEKCPLLTEEILGLEREADGHINHPENGKYGSKDQSDAVCGAIYNASLHAAEYAYAYGETQAAKLTLEVNEDTNYDDMQQLTVSFEEELKKISGMFNQASKNANNSFSDKGTDDYWLLTDNIIM